MDFYILSRKREFLHYFIQQGHKTRAEQGHRTQILDSNMAEIILCVMWMSMTLLVVNEIPVFTGV